MREPRPHMDAIDSPVPGASTAEHARLTSRAAMLSLGVALTLIVLKTWAWFVSGSLAMLASLADSGLDLAASLITYFAVRYAAAPPDREHRFGHGKAEAFAGLLQGGLVGISGVMIAAEAMTHLISPGPLSHGFESIAVMLISIALTAGLVAYQTRAVRRTRSIATLADRLHYAGDLAANVVVVIGIGASAYLGAAWADPAAALLVAALLVYGALKVGRDAADHLLDREVADDVRARIRALAEADAAHPARARTADAHERALHAHPVSRRT